MLNNSLPTTKIQSSRLSRFFHNISTKPHYDHVPRILHATAPDRFLDLGFSDMFTVIDLKPYHDDVISQDINTFRNVFCRLSSLPCYFYAHNVSNITPKTFIIILVLLLITLILFLLSSANRKVGHCPFCCYVVKRSKSKHCNKSPSNYDKECKDNEKDIKIKKKKVRGSKKDESPPKCAKDDDADICESSKCKKRSNKREPPDKKVIFHKRKSSKDHKKDPYSKTESHQNRKKLKSDSKKSLQYSKESGSQKVEKSKKVKSFSVEDSSHKGSSSKTERVKSKGSSKHKLPSSHRLEQSISEEEVVETHRQAAAAAGHGIIYVRNKSGEAATMPYELLDKSMPGVCLEKQRQKSNLCENLGNWLDRLMENSGMELDESAVPNPRRTVRTSTPPRTFFSLPPTPPYSSPPQYPGTLYSQKLPPLERPDAIYNLPSDYNSFY